MNPSIQETISHAIQNNLLIKVSYHMQFRIIEPYYLYMNYEYKYLLIAYETENQTSSNSGWLNINTSKITALRIFHHLNFTPRQIPENLLHETEILFIETQVSTPAQ